MMSREIGTKIPKSSQGSKKATVSIHLRLSPELVRQIDKWRATQPLIPTRPTAIRAFVEAAIDADILK